MGKKIVYTTTVGFYHANFLKALHKIIAEISQVTIRKEGIKIRIVASKFSIFSSESVNTLCKC